MDILLCLQAPLVFQAWVGGEALRQAGLMAMSKGKTLMNKKQIQVIEIVSGVSALYITEYIFCYVY